MADDRHPFDNGPYSQEWIKYQTKNEKKWAKLRVHVSPSREDWILKAQPNTKTPVNPIFLPGKAARPEEYIKPTSLSSPRDGDEWIIGKP